MAEELCCRGKNLGGGGGKALGGKGGKEVLEYDGKPGGGGGGKFPFQPSGGGGNDEVQGAPGKGGMKDCVPGKNLGGGGGMSAPKFAEYPSGGGGGCGKPAKGIGGNVNPGGYSGSGGCDSEGTNINEISSISKIFRTCLRFLTGTRAFRHWDIIVASYILRARWKSRW